jgi:peptidoglycan-associated lipoprotein
MRIYRLFFYGLDNLKGASSMPSRLRHLRFSVVSVLIMGLVVFLASCSKKDVISDEPVINPSAGLDTSATEGGTAASSGAATTGNAGDAGLGSADLTTVYFAYDSYNLTSEARSALKNDGDWMKNNGSARIQIEGHCDERGTNEYNMALGDRRANAVRNYLNKMGIEKSRMDVISYGEERPSDPGHDEAAWSRNRRAAFVVLSR